MSTPPNISNAIRELRFRNGRMTQQDLADRIGVSRQTLNATEGCKYSPSLKVAFLIAHTLNVTLNEVFTFTPAQTNETPASQLQPSPAS